MSTFPLQILNMNWKQKKDSIRLHSALQTEPASREPFSQFKTVDEITESQALDTDLKTWANAQGWKLTDEDQSVDISVDYDFDPEEVTEGVYEITFSTTGREFKIHTTDYSEEGQEVGLTFFPEDIHVMPKVVF